MGCVPHIQQCLLFYKHQVHPCCSPCVGSMCLLMIPFKNEHFVVVICVDILNLGEVARGSKCVNYVYVTLSTMLFAQPECKHKHPSLSRKNDRFPMLLSATSAYPSSIPMDVCADGVQMGTYE